MYNIYKILCPDTLEIMYIGITKYEDLQKRLVNHLYQAYNRKNLFNEKSEWLKNIFTRGVIPPIELIETTEDFSREKYYINLHKPILNIVHNNHKGYYDFRSYLRSIKIYQYDLDGIFLKEWKSAKEVEKVLNISPQNISACLYNRRKIAGDYIWSFYKKDNMKPYAIDKTYVAVYQYDRQGNFIKAHRSMSNIEGFKLKGISKCANNNCKTYNNFIFTKEMMTKEEILKRKIYFHKSKIPYKIRTNRHIQLVKGPDTMTFKTQVDLAKYLNVSRHILKNYINKDIELKGYKLIKN